MTGQEKDSSQTNSAVVADYKARTGKSAALFERAHKVLPSGITHDARYLDPYSIHVTRAVGPRKWDVDGNEYVDYFGGHGAMLLGHSHPAVVEAVKRQIELGTHYGSSHELEVRWAELVCELTPCAERVRFTASGTEASHMAIRLARAHTGKDKILRFLGHFHGWHDHVTAGAGATYDGGTTPGVPQEVASLSIVMPQSDVAAVVKVIEERDDIAAVMFEPSGASWGQAPLPPGFVQAVRDATAKKGVVMLMDEVITGYRWSSGGAQQALGITPDLCIQAKIVAGGLPGGAVSGKREIMDRIDHAATAARKIERILHPGTFNANPLSAAAAVTALSLVRDENLAEKANKTAAELRAALTEVLVQEGVPWGIYGQSSTFLIYPNPFGDPIDPATFDPLKVPIEKLKGARGAGPLTGKIRMGLMTHGVDVMGAPGGFVSATHGGAEIEKTVHALRQTVRALKAEREVKAA
ncbi:aminotransferase class III-fold pyridoxal phosphate-dependent enzyme [Reyranella sp. MMS21-HV4-11]|uniref:Aminotransferase class III-fold pyridoxal phosphate-dependent enzyme n=1 Tax=Reyranella humidisoli TaxID=2849149 RepID=A0ABS6IIX1_9HYPH|nr:aminotransferase class III-fold pyridoxal phosphate-dependent enzyme [Reyranella sp. MMS21-HV4-11]MBU8874375.1 aminotransferase class III-fold pyridoxal phosphate-dependent enzyme [Reyranella sp. MMS21-HV4-11]